MSFQNIAALASLNFSETLANAKVATTKRSLCLLCCPFLSHTFLITSPTGAGVYIAFSRKLSQPSFTALLIETFSIESVKASLG